MNKEKMEEIILHLDSYFEQAMGTEVTREDWVNIRKELSDLISTLIQEERKEAYKKGRNDKEKELVRNVLLDGEPRHYIGLDSPNRTLSKKYAEYLESEK